MRVTGVEPVRLSAADFKSAGSAYSPILAVFTGPGCRNRTHIRRVEADCIIHYTNPSDMVGPSGVEPETGEL